MTFRVPKGFTLKYWYRMVDAIHTHNMQFERDSDTINIDVSRGLNHSKRTLLRS